MQLKESVGHSPDIGYIFCDLYGGNCFTVDDDRNCTVYSRNFFSVEILIALLLFDCRLAVEQRFHHGAVVGPNIRESVLVTLSQHIIHVNLFHGRHDIVIKPSYALFVYDVDSFIYEFYQFFYYFS